jgi:hypothetical protein
MDYTHCPFCKRFACYCLCAGLGLSYGAITMVELTEFLRPSGPACFFAPVAPDFGPPDGCDIDGQPHPRSVFANAMAFTGSTTSTGISAGYGGMHYAYADLEDYRPDSPQPPTAGLGPTPAAKSEGTIGTADVAADLFMPDVAKNTFYRNYLAIIAPDRKPPHDSET